MAIASARAKVNGQWVTLAYNSATGRWEGNASYSLTSAHEPGGYYVIDAEVTNSDGKVYALSGATYRGLRIVVREKIAPTLSVVSPTPGWLTTSAPSFTLSAVDETNGSGIDPSSAWAKVDNVPVQCTATKNGNAYTVTFSASGLSDGPHTITAGISDVDGNATSVSAGYNVDTVAPELVISKDFRHVIDWEDSIVSGYVKDETSGVASLTVNGKPVEIKSNGEFSHTVPIHVGENTITVKATDTAGLVTTETIWVIRLVTDRTKDDVDYLEYLQSKPFSLFTAEEKKYWNTETRGGYDYRDYNRVGAAAAYISGVLSNLGYGVGDNFKTNWTRSDAATASEQYNYFDNVAKINDALSIDTFSVVHRIEDLGWKEANDLESILVYADSIFPFIEKSVFYSGEIMCGEN